MLVDRAVAEGGEFVIGGGVRTAKLLITGEQLAGLPNAQVLDLVVPG